MLQMLLLELLSQQEVLIVEPHSLQLPYQILQMPMLKLFSQKEMHAVRL